MKTAYLLTEPNGSTKLLFDGKRAHALARHKGWTVKQLTPAQAAAHIRATLDLAFAR